MLKSDILIIGGGPAGYVAAVRASQLGSKVMLVEKDRIGGLCLNRGCIPTKALWEKARFIHEFKRNISSWVKINKWSISPEGMFRDLNLIVSTLRKGVDMLLKANDVKVIYGTASFKSHNTVKVHARDRIEYIEADKILIATGSKPIQLDIPGINSKNVLFSEDVFTLDEIPSSIVIIGGGTIGVEFATIFREFGADITVVEIMPTILPGFDVEISKMMQRILSELGIKIYTNSKVNKIVDLGVEREVTISKQSGDVKVRAEVVIIAVGRRPNIDNLNLESVGIKCGSRGNIQVNPHMETSVSNIYAAGDVVGKFMLAHVAMHEGIIAAENIAGLNSTVKYDAIPKCIFTIPEIASVGLSEEEATKKGYNVVIGRFPLSACGRAWTMHETKGFIKAVIDASEKRILGIHMICPNASELIAEAVAAVKMKVTTQEFREIIHFHPSISEALEEAILDAEDRAIHKFKRRKKK